VLAGVLSAHFNAILLSTDMVRIELYGRPEVKGRAGLNEERYSAESRERVYEEIARQSEALVLAGRPVVVDGTYIERSRREPIIEVATRTQTRLLAVACNAPDEVVRERQTHREGEAWTTSEGRWEVYLEQKARIEPATELPAPQRLEVDTTQPLTVQVEAVVAKLSRL
jgi:predicted kinase